MAIDTPATIAIVGAGPIGLEAALYARYLGYSVQIYERGRVAENVLRWGHVPMFTPFEQNCSPLGIAALQAQDAAWQPPAAVAHLSGAEFGARYLLPLATSDLLADSIHERTAVVAIGRDGLLKGQSPDDETRIDCDFRLLLRTTDDEGHVHERIAAADAVIDAGGVFRQPNWLGHGGVPALGELQAQAHIEYGLPDVLGADRGRYASRSVLLIGDGDTAATNLVALAELAGQAPDTWITWATRCMGQAGEAFPMTVMQDDPLPARAKLARQANRLAADDANHVTHFAGSTVEGIEWHADLDRFSVQLAGKHAGRHEFDRVIASVGYRGDAGLYSELHVGHEPTTGAPQTINGILTHEPDFYVLGGKSRGRDSRFLIADGIDQIRRLFAIIGDRAELNLYATMQGLR